MWCIVSVVFPWTRLFLSPFSLSLSLLRIFCLRLFIFRSSLVSLLIRLIQIILNLFRRQQSKHPITLTHNPHLNITPIHLPLKPFPQRQQCRMNCILQFHIFLVTFFQEIFGIDIIFSNGGSLPSKVGTGGIHLE